VLAVIINEDDVVAEYSGAKARWRAITSSWPSPSRCPRSARL